MSDINGPRKSQSGAGDGASLGERLIYLVPRDALLGSGDDEINLVHVSRLLWRRRWFIAAVAALVTVASVAYALLATEWYRAETLLAPAEERSTSGLAGNLGGLAALAGIRVGGGGNAEPIAVLQSREFIRSFIEEGDLLKVLYGDSEQADIRDAVKLFQENVLEVSEERDTGLVKLRVTWTDPKLAAEWANTLVERLNLQMRQRALRDAEANVKYLQGELASTSLLTIQQSVARLLESEIQKLMLARGNDEFSFRVIDRAEPPIRRFKPRRTLIVALACAMATMFAAFLVILGDVINQQRSASPIK